MTHDPCCDANKELVRTAIDEIWHRGNLDFINEAFAPTFVACVPRRGFQDLHDYRRYVTEARAGFPDIRFYIEDQVAEDEYVVTRYRIRGTHTQPFMGIPASGNEIDVAGLTMHRVHDRRIAESWSCWDVIGLLHEIGFIEELSDVA